MSPAAPDDLLVLDPFDPGLLELDDWTLLRRLGRPTILRLPGTGEEPPRALITLQHGDEPTGMQAVLRVLRRRHRYPFDLHVVIGNVEAALEPPGFAHRFLAGQRDMNRLWSTPVGGADDAQSAATAAIREHLRALPLSSAVDLHNTSGANPFHALVASARPETLRLATTFTTTVVVWEQRIDALMEVLDDHCPAVAIECGLAGRPASLAFALDGVRRHLATPHADLVTPSRRIDHDLLGDMRRVLVHDDVRFRFGGVLDAEVDMVLDIDADLRNGVPTPAGWVLARVRPGAPMPLSVIATDGRDVTGATLTLIDGDVVVAVDTTPLMMTRTVDAARKDCLTYLLGPYEPGGVPPAPATSQASTSMPANRSSSGSRVQTSETISANASKG